MSRLKLMVDTNVIIDCLDMREPFYEKARLPLTAGRAGHQG